MRDVINTLLYKIPPTPKRYADEFYKTVEIYKSEFSFINVEGFFKQIIIKRKKIECFFRVMRPVNILRSRFKFVIKPTKKINVENFNSDKPPFWTIKIADSNEVIVSNNELIEFWNILLYSKRLKLRTIELFDSDIKYKFIFDCEYDSYSFLNPYIRETAAIRIQYYVRKYLKYKNKIKAKYNLCLDEILYLPPGGLNGILSFPGGIGYLNARDNFNINQIQYDQPLLAHNSFAFS